MDNKIDEGSVVICPTHQAGTVVEINKGGTWVLLRNGDVWVGELFRVRLTVNGIGNAECWRYKYVGWLFVGAIW